MVECYIHTQLRYKSVAWPSSAQLVGFLCIISPIHGFNYHQLAPVVGLRQCSCKLHFTLHAMAMLIVGSWVVHLTLIPRSLFHFCPNLARLPHYA